MHVTSLIFDVDGTMADTERDGHRVAFNRAFEAAGLDWDWSESLYGELLMVTGGKERIRYYLERFNPSFHKPDAFDTFVAELHQRKTSYYTQLLTTGAIPLRVGVARLLREARQAGMRLAIATTTTEANVSALLQHCLDSRAHAWFDVIAAGDIVPVKKPAADIYQFVLHALGEQPEACVAFEDSEHGLSSSQGAGIPTIVTLNEYTRKHCFEGAELVLDHLGEPDKPCTRISGKSLCNHTYVDVSMIQQLAMA